MFLIVDGGSKQRSHLAIPLLDIEARRSAEEAPRLSEFKLDQAQKMQAVGCPAGGIAHDFNNLSTAIIGYSDLVLDEISEGHDARRDVEEILRAAERTGGLTRQLDIETRSLHTMPERTLWKNGYKLLSAEPSTAALRHCSRHHGAGRSDLVRRRPAEDGGARNLLL